jgi:YesN/AraC family two-component response regulator
MDVLPHSQLPLSMLIVEDDTVTIEILAQVIALQFPAAIINVAENGRAGLELFKVHAPDIVVTDINMPEMDGMQMAREIKAINPDTKFIVLTAYSNNSYMTQFSEIGCCAYLLKPIQFEKLCTAIRNCSSSFMTE